MSSFAAGNAGQREGFGPGDVVWFDYPHLDTAARCPKGTPCYELTRVHDHKQFVLVMKAKQRPMLILARIPPAYYRVLKLTTKSKGRAARQLQVSRTEFGKPCYACIDFINTFPANLADRKKCVLGTENMKRITRQVRWSIGFGPPLQRAPG